MSNDGLCPLPETVTSCSIIDSVFEGIIICDAAGRIAAVNRQAGRVFGYEPDELMGQPVEVLLPERFREDHPAQRDGYFTEGVRRDMGHNLAVAALRKDGTEFTVEVGLSPLGGGLVTATVRDVSALVEAQAALLASEQRYRMLMESSADAMVVYGQDGICQEANFRFAELVGYELTQIPGMRLSAFVARDDLAARPFTMEPLRTGEPVLGIRKLVRKDGAFITVDLNSRLLPDGRVQTVARDISERLAAEEALRASEARWRSLVQNASDLVTISEADGTLRYASPSVERIMGYGPEEWMGMKAISFVHPDDLEAAGRGFLHVLSGPGEYEPLEVRIRHANGSWRFLETRATNLLDDPAVRGIVHNARDVTDEVAFRGEQARAHERSSRLLESIPSVVVSLNRSGTVDLWNAGAEATFGLSRAEVTGLLFPFERIFGDPAAVAAALQRCSETGEPQRLDDLPFKRPDGTEGLLGLAASQITDAAGSEADSILIAARDITHRKSLERQLLQGQKLEAIGRLAAGVAHEINTPTQYIGDNIRFLEEAIGAMSTVVRCYRELAEACMPAGFRPDLTEVIAAKIIEQDYDYLRTEVPRAIAQSLEGVERVAKIVQAMKEFSHPGTEEKVATDINKAILSTITVAGHEWKLVADVQTDLDENLPMVPCYPGDLNQVVLNIIVNAAHAIQGPGGRAPGCKGLITVSTGTVGPWAEIRVNDNGPGIPEAILGKIFDPFFTTKEVGKGTGQGLALAHAMVVEKHGGSIDVESELGRGATFILRLPLARGEGS
jgi:PAS domain S-box-containing protein